MTGLVCRECGKPADVYLGEPANKAKHSYCEPCAREISFSRPPRCLVCDGFKVNPKSKKPRTDRIYCTCGTGA
jgi:hypothetical protein